MKEFTNENEKALYRGKVKRAKLGTYTVVLSLVVLVVLVAVNLLLSLLPGKFTVWDTSGKDMYTISDSAARAAKKINEDVTVYYLKESGADANVQLETFLERYASLNSHIRLKTVDPVAQPGFAQNYTDKTLYNYSLVVESAKRYRVINFTDMYYYEGGVSLDNADLDSYKEAYLQYYGKEPDLLFDGEALLCSALDFVTTDVLPKLYLLSGHGETALPATLQSALKQNNLEIVENYSLLSATNVAEDCRMLVIFAPTADLNDDETAMLLSYLKTGGKLMLITLPGVEKLPNLLSVAAAYGMQARDGLVIEGDSNAYYPGYPHYLLPTVETNDLTAGMGSTRVLFPMAHGILPAPAQGVTVTPLFSTTDSSYTVKTTATSTAKDEDSVSGPFYVGAVGSAADGGSVCWFSSAYAMTDQFNSVTGGNYAYFLELTDKLCERTSILSSLDAISLADDTLVVSAAAALGWGGVLVIAIPLGFLIAGLVIWLKRRKV